MQNMGFTAVKKTKKKEKKRSASLAELEINNIYLQTHIYSI